MATTAASMSTSWTSSSSLSASSHRLSADRNLLLGMLSIPGPKASVNGLIIEGRRVRRNHRGRLQIGVALASYGGGGRSEYSSQSYNSEPRSSYGGGGRSSDANKMFVGNLPWSANDMSLQDLFGEYGSVTEARVVKDRETGRSRGFGFVSMSSTEEMNAAIQALNGYDLDGRSIRVNQAESRF